MALRDPDLPAGAIVEHLANGGAIRNDGVELEPASQNPWYVLATVAGEQGKEYDESLIVKNRRIWNGWVCQGIGPNERSELEAKLELNVGELSPLNESEMELLNDRFAKAFPGKPPMSKVPNADEPCSFQHLYFEHEFAMDRFVFKEDVHFQLDHFASNVDISRAHFLQGAFFFMAHFESEVYFYLSTFAGDVDFHKCHFVEMGNFHSADFVGDASFDRAHFAGPAYFNSTSFSGFADFREVLFQKDAGFSDGIFKGATGFERVRFLSRVPTFYQREMHQDTTFTEDPAYWPTPTPDNAQRGKQAYTRLRQIAAGNQNPDLEHFFLRQEMRCKEVLATGIDRLAFAAYRIFADYGISVARPVAGLATTVAIGWALIPAHLKTCADCASTNFIWEGLGISIGNTLPFLGLVGKMHPDFHTHAPAWIDALSALQSILGIILLFFLGLGLRNRFRLK